MGNYLLFLGVAFFTVFEADFFTVAALPVAVFATVTADFTGFASFDKELLIRAARFLCIRFFLTARSTIDTAFFTEAADFCFFATFNNLSSSFLNSSFARSTFLSRRSFFIADFITGIP